MALGIRIAATNQQPPLSSQEESGSSSKAKSEARGSSESVVVPSGRNTITQESKPSPEGPRRNAGERRRKDSPKIDDRSGNGNGSGNGSDNSPSPTIEKGTTTSTPKPPPVPPSPIRAKMETVPEVTRSRMAEKGDIIVKDSSSSLTSPNLLPNDGPTGTTIAIATPLTTAASLTVLVVAVRSNLIQSKKRREEVQQRLERVKQFENDMDDRINMAKKAARELEDVTREILGGSDVDGDGDSDSGGDGDGLTTKKNDEE